jgi:hypothetical protein
MFDHPKPLTGERILLRLPDGSIRQTCSALSLLQVVSGQA